MPLVVTLEALRTFVTALDTLCKTKQGAATLAAHEGGDTIRFHATDGARPCITGELHDAEGDQHLRFALHAEWQGVPALFEGLQKVIDALPTA